MIPTKRKQVIKVKDTASSDIIQIKDNTELYNKLFPFLALGFSLHKACIYSNINYSTVKNRCSEDIDLQNKINKTIDNIVIMSRKALYDEVSTKPFDKAREAHMFVLQNLDQDFKKTTGSGLSITAGDLEVKIVNYQ